MNAPFRIGSVAWINNRQESKMGAEYHEPLCRYIPGQITSIFGAIGPVAVASSFLTIFAGNVVAAERVGSTVAAQSTVNGEGAVGKRVIATADPIYRDERLRSNLTGLGQFELGDGTKLVLGRNASLVIDRYVLAGGGKGKTVTLKLLSGSARFVTGASDKRAYRILTPQGTIGVRGTAFDLTVKNGKTHFLLLSKKSH